MTEYEIPTTTYTVEDQDKILKKIDKKFREGNKNPKDKQVGGGHYKEMAIQPSDFIVRNNLGWYEGNAVKYICRHKMKGGKQDLLKAIHYLELALEQYYAEDDNSP